MLRKTTQFSVQKAEFQNTVSRLVSYLAAECEDNDNWPFKNSTFALTIGDTAEENDRPGIRRVGGT
jgi:hypothetical protein